MHFELQKYLSSLHFSSGLNPSLFLHRLADVPFFYSVLAEVNFITKTAELNPGTIRKELNGVLNGIQIDKGSIVIFIQIRNCASWIFGLILWSSKASDGWT